MNEQRAAEPQVLGYAGGAARRGRRWVLVVVAGLLLATFLAVSWQPRGPFSRELSPEEQCQANLRGIGLALYQYAVDEPDGRFPDDVQRIIDAIYALPRQFVCPCAAPGHQCYYYVPGYAMDGDPNAVLMFEDARNHAGRGGNVLYLDGHVQYVELPAYQAVLQHHTGRGNDAPKHH